VAVDNQRPVRIGVNGGSLNQELVMAKMQENTDRGLGHTSEEIINECMVLSALQSTDLALESGLTRNQIIISCKVSRPRDLIAVYRNLAKRTEQPLHLGLTEAGMGVKGIAWSASALSIPAQRRNRRHHPRLADAAARRRPPREVYAACEILQALGLRTFSPVDHRLPRAAGARRHRPSRSWPNASRTTYGR
jgi:(E)-4-hydroxy-3-methylbut-2-enyl-diphosphate synthase